MALVPIEQLLYGMRQVETGGQKSPYTTVNSIGAHGAYQVMRANIGPWTKEILGRAYTPAEFLASPAAQDQVARVRLERDMKKYNSWESAAAVWFSGQPNPNSSRSDGGNTVRQYVDKVRAAMAKWSGGGAGAGPLVPLPLDDSPTGIGKGLDTIVGGGITDILGVMGGALSGMIAPFKAIGTLAEWAMKLALPSTWVRITCGIAGVILLLVGLVVLGREAKGSTA